MLTVDIPIKDSKEPPELKFPDHCVNCGKPEARTWPVMLSAGAQVRGQTVQMELDVPMCADCSKKENRISNVTWLPFFIAGLLTSVMVFIPVWLVSPEGSNPNTAMFPYVLGAFSGMIAGIIVGTLVEFGLKLLLAPTYGKLLLKRPLTVFAVFADAEDLIGFSTRFAENRKLLKLMFENDEFAREFVALNPQEK